MIKVVGLGLKQGDLTLKGAETIDNASVVIVKTALTDTYSYFENKNISHETLDRFYENSDDFDDLDAGIANYLATFKDKEVAYCVNGNGADDRSVKKLMDICDIEIIAGVSSELTPLKKHPNTSVVKVSAYDVVGDRAFSYDKTLPLVIVDMDNSFIASEVKELLSRIVGEENEIIFFKGESEQVMPVYELDRMQGLNYSCGVYVAPFELTEKQEYNYTDLMRIMYKLRGKNGCEWDKAQTHESIRKNLIEEAYELVEAIDNKDIDNIIEESGDVILQGVFHTVIGEDEGEFTSNEVLTALCNKLVTRHTHIFGDVVANNADEALSAWEAAKAKEKKTQSVSSKINSVAKALPSLQKAAKYQKYLAKIGMDFKNTAQIKQKILEELQEVESSDKDSLEMECGDLLFAVVNLLRFIGVDSEVALNRACAKFARRVENMEKLCERNNTKLSELDSEQQDKLWCEVKANENC